MNDNFEIRTPRLDHFFFPAIERSFIASAVWFTTLELE